MRSSFCSPALEDRILDLYTRKRAGLSRTLFSFTHGGLRRGLFLSSLRLGCRKLQGGTGCSVPVRSDDRAVEENVISEVSPMDGRPTKFLRRYGDSLISPEEQQLQRSGFSQ